MTRESLRREQQARLEEIALRAERELGFATAERLARALGVDDYLEQAGGPTRTAYAGSTYVLRANGSVVSRRQSGWFASFGRTELMPGDAVVLPEEYQPTSWIEELKDWSQIFYQFRLGVAAFRLLR